MTLVTDELTARRAVWDEIRPRSVTGTLDASAVNELRSEYRGLRVFWGGRGVWTDKARTTSIAEDGVTVGVLHTGRHYDDDLLADGIVYHYPRTKIRGKDVNEVTATKAAMGLGLPIFVVVQPDSTSRRVVHLGWVDAFDDPAEIFLIEFSESRPSTPPTISDEDATPFELERSDKRKKTTAVTSRPGQARFSFRVLRRYGTRCAVCDVSIKALLDCGHLRPYRDGGSDDPRNGIVFCATHHRAFDRGLFGIKPDSLEIVVSDPATSLGITRGSLMHLERIPHRSALDWCWTRYGAS